MGHQEKVFSQKSADGVDFERTVGRDPSWNCRLQHLLHSAILGLEVVFCDFSVQGARINLQELCGRTLSSVGLKKCSFDQ